MAVVDVAASVVPSAAEPPPSGAVTLTYVYVGKAGACARDLSCVSVSGREWLLSQPACASTASAEGRRVPAYAYARVASVVAAVRWVEPGATARSCELD